MERQKRQMKEEINELQFQILDSVYFMESLDHIVEEAEAPRAIVIDELRTMIDKGWLQVMALQDSSGEYIRTAIFDNDHLEEYRFLATKAGLLKHTGHE